MNRGLWILAICAGAMLRRSGDWRYPVTAGGVSCSNPVEPMLYVNEPVGLFRCCYCDDMQVAGVPHTDFSCTTAGCGKPLGQPPIEVCSKDGGVCPDLDECEWHPYCGECVAVFEAAGFQTRQEF